MAKGIRCRAGFTDECEGERKDNLSEMIEDPTYESIDRTFVCPVCLGQLEEGKEAKKILTIERAE